ncbi:MAG: amidohydrolase family protein [Clostridia bacterium]|nr:amidohydrolase family protein [Clostridia bacterium]
MLKKIDIHVHTRMVQMILRPRNSEPYASPEQIREKYDAWGIEKGVIMTGIAPECGFHIQSNEESYLLAQKYPETFYWFMNLHPTMGNNSPDTDFSYWLNYYKKYGAKGVGEVTFNYYIDDPLADNLFYHCAECDMPVTIHIAPQVGGYYGIVDDFGLPRLEALLDKYPRLRILGHSQCFWSAIGKDVTKETWTGYPDGPVEPGRLVEMFENYPNLLGDLSAGSGQNAVMRDVDFGLWFLERFKDRLFYGTDVSAPSVEFRLGSWLDEMNAEGRLSDDAYRKVCRENAVRLLEG